MNLSGKEISKIRLQVFLSHSGLCSRRKALELILQGHVKVNGAVVCEPSTAVDPKKDKVYLDNALVQEKSHEYVMLNKPKGYVTTLKDVHAAKIVSDLLPGQFRHLYPVGRLDKDTEGLLLLTNDGDMTYKLTHPKFNIDKTYFIQMEGLLKENDRVRLEKGILVENEMTAPAKITAVKYSGNRTGFHITIHEGRKRQIRLMLAACGYNVVYLKRIIQGPLHLGDLPLGKWRMLYQKEITALKNIQ